MAYKKGERYKRDVLSVRNGKAQIYRTKSDIYQVQIWVNEEGKYVRKSLRTSDKETAIELAEELYFDIRTRLKSGQKIFSITAKELVEKFLEHIQAEVSIGEITKSRYGNLKTYTKHYLDFVGRNTPVKNIDGKSFKDYFAFRRKQQKNISPLTVSNESSAIKQMYKWALEEGFVTASEARLKFKKLNIKKGEGRRNAYEPDEYRTLVSTSKSWFKVKGISNEELHARRLINDFIILMSKGGFRTGELRQLKWKDVLKTYKEKGSDNVFADIRIRPEITKTGAAREFQMPRGDVFDRMREYSKYTEREDFVFSASDENKMFPRKKLYAYFNQLKDRVKAKHPSFDDSKTLYCLRHLWITDKVLFEFDVYNIAKVAGTSPNQILRHYDAVQALVASKQINKKKYLPNRASKLG